MLSLLFPFLFVWEEDDEVLLLLDDNVVAAVDRTALGFTVCILLDDDLPPPPLLLLPAPAPVVWAVETMSMVDEVASSEHAGDTLRSNAMPLPPLRLPTRHEID